MPLKESLAAVLRLTRSAQGLSQEDFHGRVEDRHISNIEHAKSSPTISTLEEFASGLGIDLVAILVIASSHARHQSCDDFLRDLASEIAKLERLRISELLPGEFENGKLIAGNPRYRSGAATRGAVLRCKTEGKTQKDTAQLLGLAKSTVSKLWRSDE